MTTAASQLLEHVERLRRSEPARALDVLEQGFATAGRGATEAERGALWRTRAHVLRSVRRTREAAAAYARASRWYAKARETVEEGRCAIGLVDALMYLGRYREAHRAARRGRRLLASAGERAALARLLNNEGNLWHRLDLPERALACYRQAVRALEREGDTRSALMIGTNVGNCLSLLGRSAEARAHYQDARRAHEQAGAANEALSARYNLAYLDFLEHHHERALEGLAGVRDLAHERGYPSLAALAALDRAEILLRLGAHDESAREADLAIAACGVLGLRYETAKAETFAALARFRSGKPAAARAGLERSLTAFHAESNAVWIGEALLGLATIWWGEGNPAAAAALLSAARARFAEAGDAERNACTATLEARALLAAGEPTAARRRLGVARRAVRRRASPRLAHLWLAAEAALARAAGDDARARALLRRAATAAERMAARILDEQWRASFWGEWGWPHRELAALELARGRFAEAFEALEAGRGRALVGVATRVRARGGLPERVRRWAAGRHARERGRLRETLPRRGAGTAVAERHDAPLARALAARAPETITSAQLRRLLPERGAFLDYLLHDGELGGLVVTRDGVSGRRALLGERALGTLVNHVMFTLRSAAYLAPGARPNDPELGRALGELASLVLWPLLPAGAQTLAIAPTGALARLPWAAMPTPDGRALCERGPLVLVPGLRLALTSHPRLAQGAPLVVAVDPGDLAAVAPETRAILAAFPHARVLAGDEASAANFMALAPSAPWIHFAGHGAFRAEAPHESGLQFVDRWLLAGEIAELELAARWVTLSACHTARALVRPGEEWFGLARSLRLAGAGTVIAAQWDVEDEATASLMERLYSRLAQGETPPGALAGAQAELLAAGAHPLEWAGFAALGSPANLGQTPLGTRDRAGFARRNSQS